MDLTFCVQVVVINKHINVLNKTLILGLIYALVIMAKRVVDVALGK
jgi:hypothetical protein